jgi:hypothetical protein
MDGRTDVKREEAPPIRPPHQFLSQFVLFHCCAKTLGYHAPARAATKRGIITLVGLYESIDC